MKILREEPIVFLLLIIAVSLRLFALDNIPGLIGDESWGFAQVQLFSQGLDYTFIVPSQRWFNPLYGFIVWLVRASDPFWMRIPSVLFGVGTIYLTYRFFKNLYDQKTALLIAAVVATFPPHIHYSRLAWDCCLIPLFSLLLTYLPLARKYILSLIVMILSFWVHPSLTFMFLPGFILFLNDRKEEGRPFPKRLILITGFTVSVIGVTYFLKSVSFFYKPSFNSAVRFTQGVFDFFTGTIVTQDPFDKRILVLVIFFAVFLMGLTWKKCGSLNRREKIFFTGSALTLLFIYILRGVWAIFPGHERTVLYLGVPFCLYVAALISKTKHARFGIMGLSTFYLVVTFLFYFNPALTTGGFGVQSHTGPQEPKYSAIKWVTQQHQKDQPLRIIAEDWSIYWCAYNFALANGFPGVVMKQVSDQVGFPKESLIQEGPAFNSFMSKGAYAIGFRGGAIERVILSENLKGQKFSRVSFKDYADEDFIYVWLLE